MIVEKTMKHHFISAVGLMLLATNWAFSQKVELRIDTLTITRIYNIDTGEISFDENGPTLKMNLSIHNDEEIPVSIHPNEAKYLLIFNFSDKLYKNEMFPLGFMDSNEIKLEPKQTIEFVVRDDIFYGAPLFSPKKTDYSIDLLKTIPTLEFRYQEPNMLLKTSRIETVKLNEN